MKNIKKRIYQYTAVFEPDTGGGFTVTFPELPGCVTFGSTMKEARAMAKEAMGLWLEVSMESGKFPPAPRMRPRFVKIASRVAVEPKAVYASHSR